MLVVSNSKGSKFLLGFVIFCFIIICVLYQFSSVFIDVPMTGFNRSFYTQKYSDPPTTKSDDLKETIDPNKVLTDDSPSWSEDNLLEDIQQNLPNLPVLNWEKKPARFNKSCAKFPSMYDLEFNNIYWQTLETSNGTFQLYGAYLDDRTNNTLGPTVRILGMINRKEPTVVTFCQFWFDGMSKPVLEKSFEYRYVWNKRWGTFKQGMYQPYLIACIIPKEFLNSTPKSISLVEKQCDTPTNNLRVFYEKPETKKDFAVCVKGLDFLHEDLSVRLVEWIEIMKLLGVDKIFFYELQVHRNISKVLTHYEREGVVEVTPTNLAAGQPNLPSFQHLYLKKKLVQKRLNELIPYNDCFYKHMYQYKYIALLDIDEVIVPVKGATWKELMEMILPKALKDGKGERGSFNARNVYFLDDLIHDNDTFEDIPRYMYMLQHVYRTENYTKPGFNIKSFHNTEKVIALHNHFPLSCLGDGCRNYAIDPNDARMHHYRGNCMKTLKGCDVYRNTRVKDTTMWKFKDSLVAAVSSTLRTLGFFPSAGG
ncbi:uncharacterized protein LOC108905894 isoform X2 [Anoplophora glabripennis]|nr:uncharacterized protein LOC108905894 isoform X2 [Anoplophora glabripennis]